ncbi:UNVERIFIED_CONTAM: hypothetical protein K2H54_040681 [Gekko kuhli]
MVSRCAVEEDPGVDSAECSRSDFWDRLIQQQRLKKAKWGGCPPQAFYEGDGRAAGPHHGVPRSPFSMPGAAAHFYEKEDSVFQRHGNQQLLCPEWDFSRREQQRIPPGSPAFPSTVVTLGRHPMAAACELEEDFGGFHLQSEE